MNSNQKIKWIIDPMHSAVVFKIKHLTIAHIRGEFTEFKAEIQAIAEDFDGAEVNAEIAAGSVFTNNEERDNHLKSADFFDAEKYPYIKLETSKLEKLDDENYQVNGMLTIKGITKPIHLDVDFGGIIIDAAGNEKAGFSFSAKINRNEYGLTWNAVLDSGIAMVSEDVRIIAEIQFVKQISR